MGIGVPLFTAASASLPATAGRGDRALAQWVGRRPPPPPPHFVRSPSPACAGAERHRVPRHCEERQRRPAFARSASYGGFESAEARSAEAEAIHSGTSVWIASLRSQ